MEYLKNNEILRLIDQGKSFQEDDITLLRKPNPSEEGQPFDTFVKDGNGVRKECTNTITSDGIIARNAVPIYDGVYNEWVIPSAKVITNYGQEVFDGLTMEFVPHQKKATVKAIKLTNEIFDILGISGRSTMEITVGWSDEPMIAGLGDYITSEGYSISMNDMQKYIEV